jgi:uncharacterized protein (DUF433 family)
VIRGPDLLDALVRVDQGCRPVSSAALVTPGARQSPATKVRCCLGGKPVVRGTRISVGLVLEELAQNPDVNELLSAHPDLTRADVQACLSYAKAMDTGEEVSPKPPKGVRTDACGGSPSPPYIQTSRPYGSGLSRRRGVGRRARFGRSGPVVLRASCLVALAAHRSALLADCFPLVLCFERPGLRRLHARR